MVAVTVAGEAVTVEVEAVGAVEVEGVVGTVKAVDQTVKPRGWRQPE